MNSHPPTLAAGSWFMNEVNIYPSIAGHAFQDIGVLLESVPLSPCAGLTEHGPYSSFQVLSDGDMPWHGFFQLLVMQLLVSPVSLWKYTSY